MQHSIKQARTPHRSLTKAVAVCSMTLVLGGCGILQLIGLQPKPVAPPAEIPVEIPLSEQPYEFTLVLHAALNVNQDAAARPSPVKTIVFLTEPALDLSSHSFDELFGMGGVDVEPDPIATVVLQPGAQKTLFLSGVKSQSRVSIAAAFREPYKTRWFASRVIEPQNSMRITASVNALNIQIGDSD